jgi:hypothetical protein
MIIPLHDEFLIIRKEVSFLLVARSGHRFSLCIETSSGEYCQAIESDDLIAVSAPEGGEIEAGVMLIELVRRYHTPLVVLEKDHPGSRRLRYVVSAGPLIETNCSILRGTHPEQHLICASEGLSGMIVRGLDGGVAVENLPQDAVVEQFRAGILIRRADLQGT